MSYDLRNKYGEEFYFSTISWAFYLNLVSIYYGWSKNGTNAPREWDENGEAWEGPYDWNAGQLVTAEDSNALAAALESWLNDELLQSNAHELAKGLSEALGYEISFDNSEVRHIQSFINFARRGEFEIW
jgi:glycosyltransferase involved in cell wall biosynthesis